jgi:hypothetical protein
MLLRDKCHVVSSPKDSDSWPLSLNWTLLLSDFWKQDNGTACGAYRRFYVGTNGHTTLWQVYDTQTIWFTNTWRGANHCVQAVSCLYCYALSKVRRCLRHNLCSQPCGSKKSCTFNRICGMKFLVTGVSMFNNFIPTLTEHERHLHLH